MDKKEKKDEKESTGNKIFKGILTGLAGIAIGIGGKILYDKYQENNKIKEKKEKAEEKEEKKEEEKKTENTNLLPGQTDTSDGNFITANEDDKVYQTMMCPISQTLMNDPVVTPYGISYERNSIEEWLKNHDTDPMTHQHLTKDMLVTNYTLKSIIKDYKEKISKSE